MNSNHKKRGERPEEQAVTAPETALEEPSPEEAAIRELRAKLAEAQARASRLEAENSRLKNENWELRIDPRTGLERELFYFDSLNKEIEEKITSGNLQKVLSSEELTADDLRKLDKIPISITQADLGYLSKYNEDPEIGKCYGEHAGGDEILKKTGEMIQTINKETREIKPALHIDSRGYRVGGDEFAIIYKLTKEPATYVANEFVIKQGTIKIEGADLPPIVNCGTASFREAVEAYVRILPASSRKELGPEEAAKKLQEMLTSIADRRAKLAKGVERLTTMTRLLSKDPKKFEKNYKWLQKGAFGMSVEEFAQLTQLVGEPLDQRIKEMVQEKLSVEIKIEEDERLRARAIIVEIADRDLK